MLALAQILDSLWYSKRRKPKICVASKHILSPEWMQIRNGGFKVISTWVDELDTTPDLWADSIQRIKSCDVLILDFEGSEIPSSALVQLGMALAYNKRIIVIGHTDCSVLSHKLVETSSRLDEAILKVNGIL